MEWLTTLFCGHDVIIIGIFVSVFLLLAMISDGDWIVAFVIPAVVFVIVVNPLITSSSSIILDSYKDKLYEHYDEYEGYIEKVNDISVDEVYNLYPYKLEPRTIEKIEKRVKDNSFLKLLTVNKDNKISQIVLWDQCAEYREITDDSLEESYYQLFKDDNKRTVILEKHISTNEKAKEPEKVRKVPKKIPQG